MLTAAIAPTAGAALVDGRVVTQGAHNPSQAGAVQGAGSLLGYVCLLSDMSCDKHLLGCMSDSCHHAAAAVLCLSCNDAAGSGHPGHPSLSAIRACSLASTCVPRACVVQVLPAA